VYPTTLGTQDEDKQNKNNPEKLTTLGTQDEDKQNKNNPGKLPVSPSIFSNVYLTICLTLMSTQHRVHKTKTNKTKTIQRN
jgi:hypothetical protein